MYRHDAKHTANYELENDFPFITLLNPKAEENTQVGNYTVRYKIKGKTLPNTTVSLYYDIDNQGYDGQIISFFSLNENRDKYFWDITKNPPKEYNRYYYIYAILKDDESTTSSYSIGKIKFLLNNKVGGAAFLADGTRVEIKPNVVCADDYSIAIKKLEEIKGKGKLYVISKAKDNISQFKHINYDPIFNSTLREFLVTHNGKEATFNKDIKNGITLIIPYSEEIEEKYQEDDLRVFYLDEDDKLFKLASNNQKVDKDKNLITAIVDHLSIYMILSKKQVNDFNNTTAYPNPFNPITDNVFTITPIPDTTYKVKIYDLRGRLIRTLSKDNGEITSGSEVIWDGRNDSQKIVADGIYFYLILSEDGSYSGKMAVEK
ncbi:MAG: T9SS type A sorting domain-containing protein [bacterium]|nr:T9SS type A sorting domain-containing protein [bacterium]